MKRVLYLEDEVLLGQIVKESLESRGLKIDWYQDGQAAERALQHARNYDLAILDVMLPGENGFVIGRRLRDAFPHFPIIYLTARTQSKDVVEGFKAGGNDYLRKPFSMEELIVRIENITTFRAEKKQATNRTRVFHLGHLRFHYHRLELKDSRDPKHLVQLSHRQGELLRYLSERVGVIIDRKELLLAVWEDDGYFNSRNLDVYVRKLRQLLAIDPSIKLITLRGVGYRFMIETV